MASCFERVRQQAGDEAGASWSIMSSRRREPTRVNKRPRPQRNGSKRTGQPLLAALSKREPDGRPRRPLKRRLEGDIRVDGGHRNSRRMIKTGSDFLIGPIWSTRREQDAGALPFKRSPSREQDRKINGFIEALGTRHRSAARRVIQSAAESEIGPKRSKSADLADVRCRFPMGIRSYPPAGPPS